jgi:excisionase family DNA binding protein
VLSGLEGPDELLVEDVAHEAREVSLTAGLGDRSDMVTTGAQALFGDGTRLLTVAEVAAAMRVSTMTVYRLIKSGDLPAVRVGHNYRVRGSDVERYLASRSVQVEGS